MNMDMKDFAILVVGFIAGYYVITHYGKTGQPA